MSTALADDELLARVELPLLAAGTKFGFNEFSRRAGDFAMSAALVTYRLEAGKIADAHVGVGGAEPHPRRIPEAEAALNGQAPGDDVFRAAAEAAANAVEAMEDHQTTAEYRRDLVRAVVRRALEHARRMTAHTKGTGMTWVGRALRRVEDPALVTGQGRFTADLPATHWVRFLRSPAAAGKIETLKAPDGAMVVTAADLAGVKPIMPMLHKFDYKPLGQPILADGEVRFVGEPIAAIVAPSEEEAEDIADEVELVIGDETPLVDARDALRRRRAADPRHRARATSSSKAASRRPDSTMSGTAPPRSSPSRRARAGRTRRRWSRAPRTPPSTRRPAASPSPAPRRCRI